MDKKNKFEDVTELRGIVELYHPTFIAERTQDEFKGWFDKLKNEFSSKDNIQSVFPIARWENMIGTERIEIATKFSIHVTVLDALIKWAHNIPTGGPSGQGPTGTQTQQGVSGQQQGSFSCLFFLLIRFLFSSFYFFLCV